MQEVFNLDTTEEQRLFIKKELELYEAEGGYLSDSVLLEKYFVIIIHYLMIRRPKFDRNSSSICKLLGASYKVKNYRSAFWTIISESLNTMPDDEIFFGARAVEKEITNNEIDEAFSFMQYELGKIEDPEERNKQLGTLAFCRVRYRPGVRYNDIRMKEEGVSSDKKKKKSPFIIQCEKFLSRYTPEKIKEYLDRFVVGQDDSKRVLSTAVYNHYLRILYPEERLIKSNVLLVGPTGCGKTELIRRISDLVNVPVSITDFSGIVATPWRGRNKEEALSSLYLKAGNDIEAAEHGIIFCDEFDKVIPSRKYSRGGDINDELQGQLLGMFEGTDIDVPLREGSSEIIKMDTTDILFVCAGAFEGLDEIVRKDLDKAGIGFGREVKDTGVFELTPDNLEKKHLISYGMKPELAGRLSAVSVLRKLDRAALRRVLTEPEDNVLERYVNEFREEDNIELTFTDEALEVIIDKVMNMNIGARGLNSIIHDILNETMFEVPSLETVSKVTVTGEAADGKEKPLYS
ncbi:MAG: ATP-dependent Clp protease ATP-binding subunit ClpX [Firmicutes bacterium ADurb.Bin354]|nr:MAG: ATP-dependent Clp protease ATP-binding subunit ClpX [Firmicutes bacterium ADurb.Bin354]